MIKLFHKRMKVEAMVVNVQVDIRDRNNSHERRLYDRRRYTVWADVVLNGQKLQLPLDCSPTGKRTLFPGDKITVKIDSDNPNKAYL